MLGLCACAPVKVQFKSMSVQAHVIHAESDGELQAQYQHKSKGLCWTTILQVWMLSKL